MRIKQTSALEFGEQWPEMFGILSVSANSVTVYGPENLGRACGSHAPLLFMEPFARGVVRQPEEVEDAGKCAGEIFHPLGEFYL